MQADSFRTLFVSLLIRFGGVGGEPFVLRSFLVRRALTQYWVVGVLFAILHRRYSGERMSFPMLAYFPG